MRMEFGIEGIRLYLLGSIARLPALGSRKMGYITPNQGYLCPDGFPK
jgi:hypothetical protein